MHHLQTSRWHATHICNQKVFNLNGREALRGKRQAHCPRACLTYMHCRHCTCQLANVQGHAGGVGQRLEEMLYKLCLKIANALSGDLQAIAQVRPA